MKIPVNNRRRYERDLDLKLKEKQEPQEQGQLQPQPWVFPPHIRTSPRISASAGSVCIESGERVRISQ